MVFFQAFYVAIMCIVPNRNTPWHARDLVRLTSLRITTDFCNLVDHCTFTLCDVLALLRLMLIMMINDDV